MPDPLVGIIANPASGKDLRRLVGAASVVDNSEKVNVVRRILGGLASAGVRRIRYMPDHFAIVDRALDGARRALEAEPLELRIEARPEDTLAATERLLELGASCIVALGGDGTARLVAKACRDVPMVAVSTGTNNALPSWIDGTAAGIAAGLVATSQVDLDACAPRAKRLLVHLPQGGCDIALVDLALSRQRFVAARALWEPEQISELFLTRAEPGAIGLSAVGAHLDPVGREEQAGLWLRLGEGGTRVSAPIVPGLVRDVAIREWRRIAPGETIALAAGPGVVALDGEREHELPRAGELRIELDAAGPCVVEIRRTIELAARAGLFRRD